MRHLVKKGSKLGRKPDHRKLLLRNLATSLIEHGRIITTQAKAKSAQAFTERVITTVKGKAVQREAIRFAKSVLLTETAQRKAVLELTPKYADRAGGYTRITPLYPRKGDGAMLCSIELV